MEDTSLHAFVIVSFLLVGVPSNVAVLWIHTRKNSRVAKNRFPLIFAAIDLFALVAVVPFVQYAFETRGAYSSEGIYPTAATMFTANGYLMTLLMATFDKFYAVMFPFKYGRRRATIFKITTAVTTVPNVVLTTAIAASFGIIGDQPFKFTLAVYNVTFALVFLAIAILYIFIIAKIIRNQRNLKKVNHNNG